LCPTPLPCTQYNRPLEPTPHRHYAFAWVRPILDSASFTHHVKDQRRVVRVFRYISPVPPRHRSQWRIRPYAAGEGRGKFGCVGFPHYYKAGAPVLSHRWIDTRKGHEILVRDIGLIVLASASRQHASTAVLQDVAGWPLGC